METTYIQPSEIRAQAWKFYFVLVAWPLYLFVLPAVYARWGLASLLFMLFPGVYLFTWMGYLMHECWHKYVRDVPHEALYNLYSWMLLTDPQLYRLTHGTHHREVNSYADAEFHPIGKIERRAARILYNFLEITLGILWLVIVATATLPRNPRFQDKYRFGKLALSAVIWALFLGGIGYLSARLFDLRLAQVAVPYLLTIWINSVVLHHSQLVEHGNQIVEGSWEQRNLAARNLLPSGPAEKLFLFFTHRDSQEHVLHHTMTKVYARPFPGRIPLPEDSVYITMRDYLGILRDMLTGA